MGKKKILFVDDELDMRIFLSTVLKTEGYEPIAARNAIEGIQKARDVSPDLVIMDVMMPQAGGVTLFQEIKKDERLKHIPIIMLTGHSEKRRVMVARDAGVTEFLAKPISAKGLYQRILTVVANPRPFIKTKHYFGPDRRRNANAAYIGVERRTGGRAEVMQQPSLLDKVRSGN